jgi:3-deoxy-D-manno-octulosonic-acid transferase
MIFGMKVFSLFDSKTKKGVRGRKESLKIVLDNIQGQKVLWMYAASLGEYEQDFRFLKS